MIRFLIRTVILLGSSAVGLIVATLLLDDMTVTGKGFIITVVIFTAAQAILAPFIAVVAKKNAPAFLGGIGLISTLIALLIASWISGGIDISGAGTWILASLIVWLATALATLLLPLVVFRKAAQAHRGNN
ncbi:phage holin family protein [soil metagenome]